MLAVTAVAASASAWFAASRLPLIVASQVADPEASFGRVVTLQAFGIAILLLPMTCALGAVFPLALAAASAGQPATIGRDVARVYASNTCGAIVGSLVGGFVLLPTVGLEITFRLAALMGLGRGARHLGAGTPRAARCPAVRGAIMATVLGLERRRSRLSCRRWDLHLLASGAYKYAPHMEVGDLEADLRAWRPLVLQRWGGCDRQRAAARRHAVAGDRREGGRVEHGRHADAAAARPPSGAAAPSSAGRSASSASAAA